jgi:hypothetical protein
MSTPVTAAVAVTLEASDEADVGRWRHGDGMWWNRECPCSVQAMIGFSRVIRVDDAQRRHLSLLRPFIEIADFGLWQAWQLVPLTQALPCTPARHLGTKEQ